VCVSGARTLLSVVFELYAAPLTGSVSPQRR